MMLSTMNTDDEPPVPGASASVTQPPPPRRPENDSEGTRPDGPDVEPPEEPAPPDSRSSPELWDRRVNRWAAWGSVATSLATVIALVFSGLATYWTGRITQDQLHQSQEADNARAQAQAALVSMWTEPVVPADPDTDDPITAEGAEKLTILNRSPDAVSGLVISGKTRPPDDWPTALDGYKPALVGEHLFFELGTLPPCARYTEQSVYFAFFEDRYLAFRDAHGRTWMKFDSGKIEQYNMKKHGYLPGQGRPQPGNASVWGKGQVLTKPVIDPLAEPSGQCLPSYLK